MSMARQIAESTGWQRIRRHISAKDNCMSAVRRLSLTLYALWMRQIDRRLTGLRKEFEMQNASFKLRNI